MTKNGLEIKVALKLISLGIGDKMLTQEPGEVGFDIRHGYAAHPLLVYEAPLWNL